MQNCDIISIRSQYFCSIILICQSFNIKTAGWNPPRPGERETDRPRGYQSCSWLIHLITWTMIIPVQSTDTPSTNLYYYEDPFVSRHPQLQSPNLQTRNPYFKPPEWNAAMYFFLRGPSRIHNPVEVIRSFLVILNPGWIWLMFFGVN